MDPKDLDNLFKGAYTGMNDREGNPIHEGDSVQFYHKGETVTCKIIYAPEWAMFCLLWPDGYKNKFPMNPENYTVVQRYG